MSWTNPNLPRRRRDDGLELVQLLVRGALLFLALCLLSLAPGCAPAKKTHVVECIQSGPAVAKTHEVIFPMECKQVAAPTPEAPRGQQL